MTINIDILINYSILKRNPPPNQLLRHLPRIGLDLLLIKPHLLAKLLQEPHIAGHRYLLQHGHQLPLLQTQQLPDIVAVQPQRGQAGHPQNGHIGGQSVLDEVELLEARQGGCGERQ